MEKIFEIYIKTTPERLWQAITDAEMRSKYHFDCRIASDWSPGSRYEQTHPSAPTLLAEGETSRSTRRIAWSRAWWPSGATT